MIEPQRCRGMNDRGYWWGAEMIDPTEPDFVEGKGIWLPNMVQCSLVANAASGMCPRHEAVAVCVAEAKQLAKEAAERAQVAHTCSDASTPGFSIVPRSKAEPAR